MSAKVHPDHHIQVARSLYSLPTRFIGKHVRVRADSRTVRIYLGTEQVKMHLRVAPGKRSTDPGDYPPGKSAWAFRTVDALLDKARGRGEHIGRYSERLLSGPLPWTTMRQGYELLRLCDRYGEARVEAACKRALEHDAEAGESARRECRAERPIAEAAHGTTLRARQGDVRDASRGG
jgi:hypothetical protein